MERTPLERRYPGAGYGRERQPSESDTVGRIEPHTDQENHMGEPAPGYPAGTTPAREIKPPTPRPVPELDDFPPAVMWEPHLSDPRNDAQPSLIGKLAAAALEIGPVARTGHNDDRGYTYATEDDLMRAVRVPLFSRHVVPLVAEVDRRRWELRRIDRDGQQLAPVNVLDLIVRVQFLDGESGEVLSYTITGSRADYDGTAGKGAMTSAVRSVLSKQFLIPLEDAEGASARPARAQTRTAPAGGPFVVKVGRAKGTALPDVTDADLAWLLRLTCREEKWRNNHDRDQAAYAAEAERRGWERAPDDQGGGWNMASTAAPDAANPSAAE